MQLVAGALVTPRLRLVRELGRGGMGSVWVAEHLGLDSQVAVKFILAALADQDAALDRFQREAKLAAQVKSPHLAQVFDHGVTDDGTPYIVMELLAGRSLAQRLAGGATLALGEAVQVVEQLARALGAAHRVGVVHRDLKPENVFLVDVPDAREGELYVKLLDFGVARSFAETASSQLTVGPIGTPAYMSPEQLHDSASVGAPSDLWSLAVVLYRALVGAQPFAGASAVALWKAIAARQFALPSSFGLGLPSELDAFFQRAFAIEPGDRFASARELSDALRRACPEGLLAAPAASGPARSGDTQASTGNAELGTAQFVRSAELGIDLERVPAGAAASHPADHAAGTPRPPSAARSGNTLAANVSAAARPSDPTAGSAPRAHEVSGSGASIGGAARTLASGSTADAPRTRSPWLFVAAGALAVVPVLVWLATRGPRDSNGGDAQASALAASTTAAVVSGAASTSGPETAAPLRQPTLGLRAVEDYRDPKGATVSNLRSASLWSAAARDLSEAAAQPGAPRRWQAARHFAEGELAFNLGKVDDAIAAFHAAIASEEGWALGHAALAQALSEKGDLAAALRAAERAQQLEPSWWGAISAGACAYSAVGRTDEAVQEFRRALELAPQNPVLLAQIALAYHVAGNDAAADRYADQALGLDPDLVSVHLLRAERALERADGKVALEEASRAAAVAPKSVSVRLAEADSLALLGRRDEARSAYARVLALAKEGGSVGAPKGRIEAVEQALAHDELPAARPQGGARGSRAAPTPARSERSAPQMTEGGNHQRSAPSPHANDPAY